MSKYTTKRVKYIYDEKRDEVLRLPRPTCIIDLYRQNERLRERCMELEVRLGMRKKS